MSGSARTTTTAVLHRGRLYAPDARHQPGANPQGWRTLWWTQG